MENVGCHPDEIVSKICFLLANTTSTIQPLDLGIIQNFKVDYRRYSYVVSKTDECESASNVVKSANIINH